MCLKSSTLRVWRGLNSIIRGRALNRAWPLVSAAAAVYSIIQAAGSFKHWFSKGRRFASKGHLTMEAFLIVPTPGVEAGWCYRHLWAEARDSVELPTKHSVAPHHKERNSQ